jgi:signal transduction histidine kinase
MSQVGGLSTGMAFLPTWLGTIDAGTIESALPAWVSASGWLGAGLVWPIDGPVKTCLTANAERTLATEPPPAELPNIAPTLLGGANTLVWQVPGTSGRLYARLAPSGHPVGAIWAERSARDPWTEADRNYLALAARLIERSAHLARAIGPILEPAMLEQRLKDASVIAGRMAHDFDNILTGIMGFTDLAQPLAPAGSQLARFLTEINSVGARGIVFTQQLHQLSRSSQVKPLPGSIATAVAKEAARLLAAHPNGARVESRVPQNLASAAMEAGPLGTVLGHVIENAVHASPPGATVVVTARAVDLAPVEAKLLLGRVEPGPNLEVTIADAGGGIKPEVRARLFAEPFYTTKVRHRGLGLAIAYRILFAHRGGIRIDAAVPPEPGTVARVVIPLASARPAVAPTASLSAIRSGGS